MNLNEALEILHEIDFASEVFEGILSDEDVKAIETVIDTVEDGQLVKHGKWRKSKSKPDITKCFVCSECGSLIYMPFYLTRCLYRYCPYCGAKMDKE